jgi:hypothetical protein
MIIGRSKKKNGQEVFVIGLSFDDLKQMRSAANSTLYQLEAAKTGLPLDVVVISGATDGLIAATIPFDTSTQHIIDPTITS